jgi:nucleotide-binding universal stress UspA family protein
MFDRVLVAIDGSDTSMRGLQAAINLAGDQQAELHVMHVFLERILPEKIAGETFVPAQYFEMPAISGRTTGRKILDEARARAGEHGLAINPILVASRGHSVAHHVLRQCAKLSADVIVMGTHGHRGLRRLLLGSDAENVVRESTVPVLLVRDAVRPLPVTVRTRGSATARKRARGASQPALLSSPVARHNGGED